MPESTRVPEGWTYDHSKAFLLLCAAGVDGFQRAELGSIVPMLQRLGVSQANATIAASEAFAHYKRLADDDTIEDALVVHAITLKRSSSRDQLASLLGTLHDLSGVDDGVSEGEQLVLTLLEQLWQPDP
jgi:hypothetical protein